MFYFFLILLSLHILKMLFFTFYILVEQHDKTVKFGIQLCDWKDGSRYYQVNFFLKIILNIYLFIKLLM